jgi:hypothetical protein
MIALSRRQLLTSSVASLAMIRFGATNAHAASGIVAGAIRWDAWYQRTDNSIFAQQNLGRELFHNRAPLHCTEPSVSEINCVGSQAVMDLEIQAAAKGGLKFWAFVWYDAKSSLRAGWNLYQSSRYRGLVNWCGIVPLAHLGSLPSDRDRWRANMEEWSGYMQQSNYQKVTINTTANRPLLFILWNPDQLASFFGNSFSNLRASFKYLSDLVTAVGLGSPYIVILYGPAGAPIAKESGADAISNYIPIFRPETAGPYADLDSQTRNFWAAMSKTGVATVPIAIVGWDTRPRLQPDSYFKPKNYDPKQYYVLPTPPELATHVRAAVAYIQDHPIHCPSKILLIYAWDECDEGGALMPTRGDPSGSYLSAIAPIIS